MMDDLLAFHKHREDKIVHLFPDLCPAFLKEQAWQIGEEVGAFELAVEQLLQLSSADRKRLQSRIDSVARAESERWSIILCQT